MEAAAELVVDPAFGHLLERMLEHLQRLGVSGAAIVPRKQSEIDRRGKFRSPAEAAVHGVVRAGESFRRGPDRLRTGHLVCPRRLRALLHRAGELRRDPGDAVRLLVVDAPQLLERSSGRSSRSTLMAT
jgi:hypothetical protein